MIVAMVAVLLIAGSVTYYYVFYLPGNIKANQQLETEKQNAITSESIANKKALNDCLNQAKIDHLGQLIAIDKDYQTNWDTECKSRDLPANNPLPIDIANKIEQQRKDQIDRADKEYENAKADCFKLHQ